MNLLSRLFLMALNAFLIAGCGGGGGGGGGGTSTAPEAISYTGLTTQALITPQNVNTLVNSSLEQGRSSSSASSFLGVVEDAAGDTHKPRLVMVADSLDRVVSGILQNRSAVDEIVTGAIVTETDTDLGLCGGSATYTVSVNDVTGSFTGNVTFNGYCDYDVTITGGSIEISGEIDPVYGDPLSAEIVFNNLTMEVLGESGAMSGSIEMSFIGTPLITMDVRVRDDLAGKVYWVRNFRLSIYESFSYVDIVMSGQFYEPDYGYVVLATAEPLRFYDTGFWPVTGRLIATGLPVNGGANTTARLTAFPSSYQIEADTTGDGMYDVDETFAW